MRERLGIGFRGTRWPVKRVMCDRELTRLPTRDGSLFVEIVNTHVACPSWRLVSKRRILRNGYYHHQCHPCVSWWCVVLWFLGWVLLCAFLSRGVRPFSDACGWCRPLLFSVSCRTSSCLYPISSHCQEFSEITISLWWVHECFLAVCLAVFCEFAHACIPNKISLNCVNA